MPPVAKGLAPKADAVAMQTDLDLFLMVDTTASMNTYIRGVRNTLVQVLSMSRVLFGTGLRVRIVSYKDYGDEKVVEYTPLHASDSDLVAFALALEAKGTSWVRVCCLFVCLLGSCVFANRVFYPLSGSSLNGSMMQLLVGNMSEQHINTTC
jgi:hypothetical protein